MLISYLLTVIVFCLLYPLIFEPYQAQALPKYSSINFWQLTDPEAIEYAAGRQLRL